MLEISVSSNEEESGKSMIYIKDEKDEKDKYYLK
jgi:hypothetical protein